MNAKQRQLRHGDYVGHVLDAARQVQHYTQGLTKEAFLQDRKTQDAVILKLLVIGEAAAQILHEHPTFAQQHADVPWAQMKGMRNRMVHGYFETNPELVWQTVQAFVPELEAKLQATASQQPPT